MSSIRRHSRLLLVAVSCVVIGASAGAIAGAGASTTSASASSAPTGHHRGARAADLRRLARRAVHGDLVLATKQGFQAVTFDRGKVDSVSGQQLTIAEGTQRATYKTVTLTIPTGARVRDNRQKATLSDLKAGQRVIVIQAPKQTYVIAHTPKTA